LQNKVSIIIAAGAVKPILPQLLYLLIDESYYAVHEPEIIKRLVSAALREIFRLLLRKSASSAGYPGWEQILHGS